MPADQYFRFAHSIQIEHLRHVPDVAALERRDDRAVPDSVRDTFRTAAKRALKSAGASSTAVTRTASGSVAFSARRSDEARAPIRAARWQPVRSRARPRPAAGADDGNRVPSIGLERPLD